MMLRSLMSKIALLMPLEHVLDHLGGTLHAGLDSECKISVTALHEGTKLKDDVLKVFQ